MNFKLLLKYPTLEIMDLLEYKDMTVREIKEKLNDVPKATLYRHIKKMYENKLIRVSKTKMVNGLKQHTYTLHKDAIITEEDFKNISGEERTKVYLTNFMSFIKSLIKIFRKNTLEGNFSVTFIKFKMHVTKEESKEMYRRVKEVLDDYTKNEPREDRNFEEIALIHQDIEK